MAETTTSDSQTYQIEIRHGSGHVTDPYTGEDHEIMPNDDARGGVITVANPASAKALVDASATRHFCEKAPTEEEIRAAQTDALGFEATEPVRAFAERRRGAFGTEEVSPTKGFDPQADEIQNDTHVTIKRAYEQLRDNGHPNEAAYLRGLTSRDRQKQFVYYLRDDCEGYL